jgi:hypothetical protein
MSKMKLDGVIEAVRYSPDGKIIVVRAYERHGVVWSDHVLLGRKELSERLKQGKKFVVGERKTYLGSVFETGKVVRQTEDNIITEGQTSTRDLLAGVARF